MTKKINSITVFKYDLPPGNPEPEFDSGKFYKHSYTEMNVFGEVTLDVKYLSNGEVDEKTVRTFNEKGNPVEQILYIQGDEIAEHKTFETDDRGKVIKVKNHYADGTFDTTLFKYNPQGLLLEKTTIDSDNEVEARENFIYQGERLAARNVQEFGEIVAEESFTIDATGKVTETTKLERDGETEHNQQFWDDKGRLIKILTYNRKEKLIAKMLYTYNDSGLITETDYETVRGRVITSVKYDDHGNAIEQTETNGRGEVNHSVTRKYNEENDVILTNVFINRQGRDVNEKYILKYEYVYFED